VLVIGATGLLGRPVSNALRQDGFDVHVASRRIEPSSTSHQLDLADLDETSRVLDLVKPDVVVQMTGGAVGDAVHLARANVVPTVNLLNAVSQLATPPALFVTGSAAEYGDPGRTLAAEDMPLRPLSAYGWMKLAETAVAGELGRLHGLDVTVIRPFNPVMPEIPRATALGNLRHQLLDGSGRTREVVCGRTDIVRDFIPSSFLGVAIAELIQDPPGGIVNVCSGEGIRLLDIFHAAAAHLGLELELRPDPDLVAIPAPDYIVGDPSRLHSLIRTRTTPTAESLASALLDPMASRSAD
jgi:nucleoside-diphosphate-sugar epimerase